MIHQKTTQNAIAAMSRLAELYADSTYLASSREIAEARNLSVPFVAKVLTVLSQRGLVTGLRGPGGGYRLAKPPSEISLNDVVVLFEREDATVWCPFGPGWCGNKQPCPIHDSLSALQQIFQDYLKNTTFDAFENREPSVPIDIHRDT